MSFYPLQIIHKSLDGIEVYRLILRPECISCILTVRLRELRTCVRESSRAYELSVRFLERAWRVFKDVREATRCATELYRIVLELCPGVVDYYRDVKRRSIDYALKYYDAYKSLLDGLDGYDLFRIAVKIAISGNLLDTGVAEYKPPEAIGLEEILSTPIAIDHTRKLYNQLSSGGYRILYLLDNAGESVLDTILASVLRSYGNRVVGVVKSDPGFQNDVTASDAEYAGLHKYFDRVMETGSSSASIHLDLVSREFLNELDTADIIISKGMAHYEYLTDIEEEIGKQVYYLLVPKCNVIAGCLGVSRYKYIVYTR